MNTLEPKEQWIYHSSPFNEVFPVVKKIKYNQHFIEKKILKFIIAVTLQLDDGTFHIKLRDGKVKKTVTEGWKEGALCIYREDGEEFEAFIWK